MRNSYGLALAGPTSVTTTSQRVSGTTVTTLPTSITTNSYVLYDAAQLDMVRYQPDAALGTVYATEYSYTRTGVFTKAHIVDARARDAVVINDALGQAIRRDESDIYGNPHVGGDPHEIWYRFDGRQLGYVGNNGSRNTAYAASLVTRAAPPAGGGAFAGGATTATAVADFDQQYDAINSYSQGAAGGSYTVRGGDTLAGIAQALWGDAALWYKLAEANGLTANSALPDGLRLTIPSGVNRSHNNAGTNRVYDPNDAYGDTAPTSPTTPKPQKAKKGCGVVGQIILIAVAVAVSAVTYGALTGPSTTLLGAIGAGAAAGAAGSVASQGLGVATGLQDKFSFKGVALAAIAGGVGGGLSNINAFGNIGSKFAGDALRGALGSAISQGIGVATGLQNRFDFAGVAAAGLAAGIGGAVGRGIGGSGIATRLAANTAGGVAAVAARSLVEGSSFGDTLMSALPGIIGNTIGGYVGDRVADDGRLRSGGGSGRGAGDSTSGSSYASGTSAGGGGEPGDIVVTARRDIFSRADLVQITANLAGAGNLGQPTGTSAGRFIRTHAFGGIPGLPTGGSYLDFFLDRQNQDLPGYMADNGYFGAKGQDLDLYANYGQNLVAESGTNYFRLQMTTASLDRFAGDTRYGAGWSVVRDEVQARLNGLEEYTTAHMRQNLREFGTSYYEVAKLLPAIGTADTLYNVTQGNASPAEVAITIATMGRGKGIARAAEGEVADGLVYLRTDTTGKLAPYVGQTTEANELARQAAHARAYPNARFEFETLESGIPKGAQLDIAEHNAIQARTGGVAARRSSAVSNQRDPVGPRRRPTFGFEPRRVCRRRWVVSHAAISMLSAAA